MAEHKQRRHEDIVLTHGYAPRLMPPIELDPQTQVVDDQQDLTQPKIESANVAGRLTKKNGMQVCRATIDETSDKSPPSAPCIRSEHEP